MEIKHITHRSEPEVRLRKSRKIVVIGASTGGPRALQHIIPLLPSSFDRFYNSCPAHASGLYKIPGRTFEYAIHDPGEGSKRWRYNTTRCYTYSSGRLSYGSKTAATNGKTIEVITLNKGQKVQGVRPSIDVLLNSVASVYGVTRLVWYSQAWVLTVCVGSRNLKKAGGKVIAEDESLVWSSECQERS